MSEIKRCAALGFFDGVHIGHAALLERTVHRAAEIGAVPAVVSFDVHPDNVVFGGEVRLINSTSSRAEIISELFGIDDMLLFHFDRELMSTPWRDFADMLVSRYGIVSFVVGHDFCFGSRGEGTADKLMTYCAERGLGCDVIPAVTLGGVVVSSTYIRELIEKGDMLRAGRFLGHPHILSGTVGSGLHLGSHLGAPTINMSFPDGVIVPRHGVYATKVRLGAGEEYTAVTNVGVRPTTGSGRPVNAESHLLGFSGDLYGRKVRVEFHAFLRDERRFDSLDALSAQIAADAERAREFFEHEKADSTDG